MKDNQRMRQSLDHVTPREIILAAKAVMDCIDLDPASNALANTVVQATNYYTTQHNGLAKPWRGRVWVSPPSSYLPLGASMGVRGRRSQQQAFYFKAVDEWTSRRAASVLFLGFTLDILHLSLHSERPSAVRFPFCILRERMDFLTPVDGKLVALTGRQHANLVIYFPEDDTKLALFENVFSCFGDVVIPRSMATRAHSRRRRVPGATQGRSPR